MKLSLLIILFLSVVLDASYIRSIRVASVTKEEDAQKILATLNTYISEQQNIINLQNKNNFEIKFRKSGKYLVVVIEPLINRKVLQEILDTLRKRYKGIYVTKLKSMPKSLREHVLTATVVPESIPDMESVPQYQAVNSLKIKENKQEPAVITKIKKDKIKCVDIPLESNNTSKEFNKLENKKAATVPKKRVENTPVFYENIWKILFFISTFIVIVFIRFFYKFKVEKELYINRNMIVNEKLEQLYTEMHNKDKFLANSSHELRTPMTAIMGLTYLVLENDLPESQRVYVKNIQNSAEHLLNIINDILDISKMKAGELKLEAKEFNINNIFEYVVNIVAIKIKDNNVKVRLNIESDIPSHVVGDSLRLGQILINLLANAVKFTKDGEIVLGVKKLSQYSETLLLEFSVSDTGIGISETALENIFNSYTQATDATSRKFGGTGLGLSISKQLVEMMGGTITVKSTKDVGTTFIFTAQFKLKDAQNKRQYRLPSASFLNKRILIVDSIESNVMELINAFGYFNYTTHSIPSFEEAILEKDMKFNILIINQNNLTKLAITKIKKMKLSSDNKLKLVILSELQSSLKVEILKGLNVGAYLKIPFTQQSILNMIIELYVVKNLDKYSRKKSIKDKLKEIHGKRVLVAEDNVLNHKVIAGLLAGTGIDIIFVLNGLEAVKLLQKGIKFDLILMDINMPVLNGYEATKEIRKNKKYNNVPIIALTADVTKEAMEKSFVVGMQGHIAKPIIIDIFYSKILNMLTAPVKRENNQLTIEHQEDEFKELTVSVGLNRCNNDKDFYESILKDFKGMYIDSAKTLGNLCENGQFKEARQMSVDIKDVALNIGAYNLCESSAAMEYEFEKGDRGSWEKLISFYESKLEKLFSDIDKYIKESRKS